MHKLKIKIGKGGKTEVKVEGFSGSGCGALTKAIESALGTTVDDKKTADFYKIEEKNQQKQTLGG
jgi:hypothetical protein